MIARNTALLAAVLCSTAALPAFAESFSASTNPGFVGVGPCGSGGTAGTSNSPTPVSASIKCVFVDGSKSASAAAAPGTLHAIAKAAGFSESLNADAGFTGAVNFGSAASGNTTVKFVIPLSGVMAADIGVRDPLTDPDQRSTTVSVHASLSLLNSLGALNAFGFDETFTVDEAGVHDHSLFSNFTAVGSSGLGINDLILTSGEVVVPLNTDIRYNLALTAFASSVSANGVAMSDFSHTFGFKVGQPAPFILQDGVTANSGDFIVNNVVVDPNAAVGDVPEPSSWALMLLGFGGLGAVLRRTHRPVRGSVA